jgi:hypothetical protein
MAVERLYIYHNLVVIDSCSYSQPVLKKYEIQVYNEQYTRQKKGDSLSQIQLKMLNQKGTYSFIFGTVVSFPSPLPQSSSPPPPLLTPAAATLAAAMRVSGPFCLRHESSHLLQGHSVYILEVY